MLLKYFHKNNIGLKEGINHYDNILFTLVRRSHLTEDWLNLLSNICNQCNVNIEKEYIDKAIDYIKKKKENEDKKFTEIDYESMILNKFRIDESSNQ